MHACLAYTIEYMNTKFGVDSSSRFSFRVRTNRQRQTGKQTDATERPTHTGSYTAGVGNNNKWSKDFHERPHCCLVSCHPSLQRMDSSNLGPCKYILPWVHMSRPPNGILISSAVFAYTAEKSPNTFQLVDNPLNCPFHWLFGSGLPDSVPHRNASMDSSVFAGLTNVTNRQTDRPRYSVCSNRPPSLANNMHLLTRHVSVSKMNESQAKCNGSVFFTSRRRIC